MLPYTKPRAPRPITIIGAGGIVHDAHLPAYRMAGFPVHGICDLDPERAKTLAAEYGIGRVYGCADEAFRESPANVVFDFATPPDAITGLLERIPENAAVLIQKPMGRDISEARAIRALCRRKNLTAAVNFQLRYAPGIVAARRLIDAGVIGELHDLEVRVTVFTPWQLWSFLEALPRMEIPLHSIHYLDMIRSFLGEPRAVWARTTRHPKSPRLASSRTHVILDYGELVRASVSTNHGHAFGLRHQESYVKWEGTNGAIKTRLGLLMDYPEGVPDEFEFCMEADDWYSMKVAGSWFPNGFIGTMGSLMNFVDGACPELPTSVEDAYRTMELVEACYASNDSGGTPVAHD